MALRQHRAAGRARRCAPWAVAAGATHVRPRTATRPPGAPRPSQRTASRTARGVRTSVCDRRPQGTVAYLVSQGALGPGGRPSGMFHVKPRGGGRTPGWRRLPLERCSRSGDARSEPSGQALAILGSDVRRQSGYGWRCGPESRAARFTVGSATSFRGAFHVKRSLWRWKRIGLLFEEAMTPS